MSAGVTTVGQEDVEDWEDKEESRLLVGSIGDDIGWCVANHCV